MIPTTADAELERDLFALVRRERRARDTGDWDLLAGLYWPDGVVRVTWFEGSPADYIEGSKQSHVPGRVPGRHLINPSWCAAVGDRALVESQGEIQFRRPFGSAEVDVTNWCRFLSRLERRQGEWRLLTFDSVYGKDRMEPVVPGSAVAVDRAELAAGRASYQFLTYLNNRSGAPVPQDLPGDDRPDLLEAFYADALEWLELGTAAREGRWRPTAGHAAATTAARTN
ncbi:MAG: nuclear transport factor 2 family protein [Propionibacteriaceae bacterium]|jgi:hypothetical protein|nr:nuclear transport factor 2 family protein [Propionibacteriaceae bacterium]